MTMTRRCHCDRDECRLCWLFRHDESYQALWGDAAEAGWQPAPRIEPCIHLGPVLDRLGCACLRKWRRRCELHQTCTLEICQNCPDYEPDE